MRSLNFYLTGEGDGHIQSPVLGSSLLTLSFIVFLCGLLADLIVRNRQLNEVALEKIRGPELNHSGLHDRHEQP